MTSQLYMIQGDIISQLYGSNLDADPELSLPTMLEEILKLEQRLAQWRRELFPQLHQRPWEYLEPESVSVSSFEPVFDNLSVITTLSEHANPTPQANSECSFFPKRLQPAR